MIEDVKQRRSLIAERRCDVLMQKQNSIDLNAGWTSIVHISITTFFINK